MKKKNKQTNKQKNMGLSVRSELKKGVLKALHSIPSNMGVPTPPPPKKCKQALQLGAIVKNQWGC